MFVEHNYCMSLPFWNRTGELALIKRHTGKGAFGYVTGRRRVGKTATLLRACDDLGGLYHQAVEGTPQQQLLHLIEEIRHRLPIFENVTPKNWHEFFALLSREKLPPLIVFDEFPYWVEQDKTLASIFQKWIDHELAKTKTLVLVSGSSQSMLYAEFLNQKAPLYGRASFHLHLSPLSYDWFCKALSYEPRDPVSFERYSLVGGVPHYWKLIPKGSLVEQASELYFQSSALLSEEPAQYLRDEGVTGAVPKAILDFVGRGVHKGSELSSRLGIPQTSLSRPLALLIDLKLILREYPFGQSAHSTKKALYRLDDPSLSFYYGSFLPSRSRWFQLNTREKEAVIHQHAASQWESLCRRLYPESARYWEKDLEIDLVAHDRPRKTFVIGECKWKKLERGEEKDLLQNLQARFFRSQLGMKLKPVEFCILSQKDLPSLALRDSRPGIS